MRGWMKVNEGFKMDEVDLPLCGMSCVAGTLASIAHEVCTHGAIDQT